MSWGNARKGKREEIERSPPLTLSFSSSPSKLNEPSVSVLSHIRTIKCLNLIKHHSTTRLRVVSLFLQIQRWGAGARARVERRATRPRDEGNEGTLSVSPDGLGKRKTVPSLFNNIQHHPIGYSEGSNCCIQQR